MPMGSRHWGESGIGRDVFAEFMTAAVPGFPAMPPGV